MFFPSQTFNSLGKFSEDWLPPGISERFTSYEIHSFVLSGAPQSTSIRRRWKENLLPERLEKSAWFGLNMSVIPKFSRGLRRLTSLSRENL